MVFVLNPCSALISKDGTSEMIIHRVDQQEFFSAFIEYLMSMLILMYIFESMYIFIISYVKYLSMNTAANVLCLQYLRTQ